MSTRRLRIVGLLLTAVTFAVTSAIVAQQQSRVSPHETIDTKIGAGKGGKLVTVTYGRPYSKDKKSGQIRKIWGGLVPWGKAWRAGSDEATTLITQADLDIGGTTVPAGAYTLYLVPEENGPTKLAISTKIGAWGIPVDEKKDLARVDMKKEPTDKQIDQFTIVLESTPPTGGVLKMMWENTQFSVPFSLKK